MSPMLGSAPPPTKDSKARPGALAPGLFRLMSPGPNRRILPALIQVGDDRRPVVAIVASQPTSAKKLTDKHPCGKCTQTDVCGQGNQVPKLCGPTKNGPWSESTYSCCCCVEGGQNNWFWGG